MSHPGDTMFPVYDGSYSYRKVQMYTSKTDLASLFATGMICEPITEKICWSYLFNLQFIF